LLVVQQIAVLVAVLDALFPTDDFLVVNRGAWRDDSFFLGAGGWYSGRGYGGGLFACADADLCVLIILKSVSKVQSEGSKAYACVENVAVKVPLLEQLDLFALVLRPHVAIS
jgi:hypothetical protein